MKEVRGWRCEQCGTLYDRPEKAGRCESEHRPKESMEIDAITYRDLDGFYGLALANAQKFPSSVRIKFSEEYGDFAVYKLEHIGHRGL